MMDFPNEATIVSKLDLHRCVPSIDTSCDSIPTLILGMEKISHDGVVHEKYMSNLNCKFAIRQNICSGRI